MDIWAVVREFGLPLAGFAAFVYALGRRSLRVGTEVDRHEAKMSEQWDKERAELLTQIAYRDTLRQEEKSRGDRLEAALSAQTVALRDVTEVLKDVEREIVRQPTVRPRKQQGA